MPFIQTVMDIFTNSIKSSVSSPNIPNQVRQNYEQGKVFQEETYNEHIADKSTSARGITVKTQSGNNVRIDMLSKDSQGNIVCIECKVLLLRPSRQIKK